MVYQARESGSSGTPGGGGGGRRRVNQLFKADFFGEAALLSDERRCAWPGCCASWGCCAYIRSGSCCEQAHAGGMMPMHAVDGAPAPTLPCRRCSAATVEATTALVCLTLDRATFTAVLGPLQQLMSREKSPAVTAQRLMKLQARGGPSRVPAEVMVRRKRRSKSRGTDVWEVIRARGHLDEVLELRGGSSSGGAPTAPAPGSSSAPRSSSAAGGGEAGAANGGTSSSSSAAMGQLVLTEGQVLGGGAFSRVSVVSEQTTGRTYALKRMRKSAVVQCPEHVFCEQAITRNLTHPFCIRQYASFQVRRGVMEG